MKKIVIVSSIVLFLDQIIKSCIMAFLPLYDKIQIIDNFFDITYVRNYGAAFSILTGNVFFLIVVSIAALVAIYYFFIKGKKLKIIEMYIYGFLIGGLIGNLLDRMLHGYVVDYLSFDIFGYHYPVFNLADMCIVLSGIALVFIIGGEENVKSK